MQESQKYVLYKNVIDILKWHNCKNMLTTCRILSDCNCSTSPELSDFDANPSNLMKTSGKSTSSPQVSKLSAQIVERTKTSRNFSAKYFCFFSCLSTEIDTFTKKANDFQRYLKYFSTQQFNVFFNKMKKVGKT